VKDMNKEAFMERLLTRFVLPLSFTVIALLTVNINSAFAIGSTPEAKNMRLVGFNNLQARSAYQPIIHQQDGRWIAYIGHHGGSAVNPMTGNVEANGTSIVDVTDPKRPRYLKHLPGASGAGEAGGAQMVRACSAKDLPNANLNNDPDRKKHYLLRGTASSHEVYDVSDPSNPKLVSTVVSNLGDTHKNFWECDTGIAYLVSDGTTLEQATPSSPNWRAGRMTQIFDLSNPAKPVFIRSWGLVGQEPGSTGPVPQDLHGPISIGPKGIRGVTERVYFGHGTGSDGILQIVDRKKLLDPAANGCAPSANFRTNPTEADLLCPQLGRLDTSPTMGAHTTFPLLRQPVPSLAAQASNSTRDFVILVNEAGGGSGAGICTGNRELMYFVDVTTGTSGNEAKPTIISNYQVDENSGDFCNRGGRFGAHASSENFTDLFYGKLIFVSWFNAGVRAIDIRDPFSPKEVGYYIPATTADTDIRCTNITITPGQPAVQICNFVIQTNNVEVDERGFIYIVDRANTGMHILELHGKASEIIAK
jgi:LVIVD repeat